MHRRGVHLNWVDCTSHKMHRIATYHGFNQSLRKCFQSWCNQTAAAELMYLFSSGNGRVYICVSHILNLINIQISTTPLAAFSIKIRSMEHVSPTDSVMDIKTDNQTHEPCSLHNNVTGKECLLQYEFCWKQVKCISP